MHWWIRNPRGLAVPVDMPRLDIDSAIDRGWVLQLRRPDFPRAWLLVPVEPVYLPTYPLPHSFEIPGSWTGPRVNLAYLDAGPPGWWVGLSGLPAL